MGSPRDERHRSDEFIRWGLILCLVVMGRAYAQPTTSPAMPKASVEHDVRYPRSAPASTFPKLVYMTEDAPPYNFIEHGEIKGISVELLHAIWKKLKIAPEKIQFLPWARAYYLALQKHNTVLFTTTRIDSREHLFQWVCPVGYLEVVLLANRKSKSKSKSNISIRSEQDFKKYRIAAIRSDVGEQALFQKDLDDQMIILANTYESAIKLLQRGRTDLLSVGKVPLFYKLRSMGINPREFMIKWRLDAKPLCFAFHRGIDPKWVQQFNRAMSEVNAELESKQLLKKYGIGY